jgi:hypothetical protein
MISGKIFFFSVFVCTLGKCSGKYSTLCVWSNVKQINRKYPHPKPPESTKNDHPCQPTTHPNPPHNPATHPNPPCNPTTHPAAHPNPPRNPLEQKPPHRTTRDHQKENSDLQSETHNLDPPHNPLPTRKKTQICKGLNQKENSTGGPAESKRKRKLNPENPEEAESDLQRKLNQQTCRTEKKKKTEPKKPRGSRIGPAEKESRER